MTRSDQLCQALSKWHWLLDNGTTQSALEYLAKNDPDIAVTLADAARFALRVWEGDEQLVETVRDVIENIAVRDEFDFEIPVGVSDEMARAVLAAITEEDEK